MRRIAVIAIALICGPSMAQFAPPVLPYPGMSSGYGYSAFPSYGGYATIPNYGYPSYGARPLTMPMTPYQMPYTGYMRPMYPPFGGYGYMPQPSMGNSSMLPLLGLMGMMAMMSSMSSVSQGSDRPARHSSDLDLDLDRSSSRPAPPAPPPPEPIGENAPTYRAPVNPLAPPPEPIPGEDGGGQRTGDVVGGAAAPAEVPPMTPRPPERRPGIGAPERETPSPQALKRIRARNADERRAQSAPVWNTFIKNFDQCAPGCEPARYASWGERGHRSCHQVGRALDVFDMICNGHTYSAINNGRFEQMVMCMKKKMKVIWHNGPDVTLGHRNHAHFSITCFNGSYW